MNTEPKELALLTRASQAIAEAQSIDEILKLRNKAQAARCYIRKASLSHELGVQASIVKLRAERKLGEILLNMDLANSSPGNQWTGKLDRSHDETGPISLRNLGISKSDSHRAQKIASVPDDQFEFYLCDAVKSGAEPTTAGALRLAKETRANTAQLTKNADRQGVVSDLNELLRQGLQFSTIYADPPWSYNNRGSRGAADNHYPTMTLEEICKEPVSELAADNAHLHLWTTNTFLPAAFTVLTAWGFEYKSCFVWIKDKMGLGNYWRVTHEFLLLGVRGKLRFQDKGLMSWVHAKRTRHSRKPAVVRHLIEKASPPPYLELYGREELPNWTVYGNQVERTQLPPNNA